MLHIGIDVHQKSSVFNVFNPAGVRDTSGGVSVGRSGGPVPLPAGVLREPKSTQ